MGNHVNCRVCSATLPPPFLNLGRQAPANNLCISGDELTHDDAAFPLAATRCSDCGLVQLDHVVDPRLLFDHYLYATTGQTFDRHFAAMAHALSDDVGGPGERGLVVDIGSNNGLLLSKFKALGWLVLGVDPAKNLAAAAAASGIPTLSRFWDEETAIEIRRSYGPARLITANNVFAHLDDVASFARAVKALLSPSGYFVAEVVSLKAMLGAGTWDLLYHEHVTTWSVAPLARLFADVGLQLVRVQDVPSHGGSLRCWVRQYAGPGRPEILVGQRIAEEQAATSLSACLNFATRAWDLRGELLDAIDSRRRAGKRVVGYGAPAKATVVCNYLGIRPTDVEYIVDDNPLKVGRFMPGTHIPIVGSGELERRPPDSVIIFPWNLEGDIRPKLAGRCSEVIVPMPELRVSAP